MRVYSVFVIAAAKESNIVRISDYTTEKTVEVLTFGESTLDYDVAKMLRCHVVVTFGNWHEDENCKKAVEVARIMNKDIVFASQFKKYAEENNY